MVHTSGFILLSGYSSSRLSSSIEGILSSALTLCSGKSTCQTSSIVLGCPPFHRLVWLLWHSSEQLFRLFPGCWLSRFVAQETPIWYWKAQAWIWCRFTNKWESDHLSRCPFKPCKIEELRKSPLVFVSCHWRLHCIERNSLQTSESGSGPMSKDTFIFCVATIFSHRLFIRTH